MSDTPFSKEQLAKLKAAYASGVLRYRHGETEVTYQSMEEMRKAISRMEREMGRKERRIRLSTVEYSRGL